VFALTIPECLLPQEFNPPCLALSRREQVVVDFGKILAPKTTIIKRTWEAKAAVDGGFAERRTVQDFAHRALRISAHNGFGHKPGYWLYPWERSAEVIGSGKERDSQTNWAQQTVLLGDGNSAEGGKILPIIAA
jgi:hypothetical protein